MLGNRKAIGVGVIVIVSAAWAVTGLANTTVISLNPDSGDKIPSRSSDNFVGSKVNYPEGGPDASLANRAADTGPAADTGTQHEPSAFRRAARATDTPLAETRHLAADARRIATTTIKGELSALYVGRQSDKMTCLILQDQQGRGGGGCNPAGDPFNGQPIWWSSYQANQSPAVLIVYGVVDDGVRAVRLAFNRSPEVAAELSADGGFIYPIRKDTITQSDVPDALVSFDAKGGVIARIPLGITFGL